MNTKSAASPFFEFEWRVAPDYRWAEWLDDDLKPVRRSGLDAHQDPSAPLKEEVGHETGPVLMIVPGPHRTIYPMGRDHAALFRRFAGLNASDTDAVLEFARQFGWLGYPGSSQLKQLPDGTTHYAQGEPHQLWVNEVAKIREAIWLCEHPKSRDRDAERLAWLFDSHLQHVQGRMKFAADGSPELRIEPLSLLSAMWLQLAMAVAGKKDFVKCRFCERQIEISTAESGFRTNRVFCSQSCKTNDYRARKREAVKLARAGTGVANIAKRVDTDLATVRRWLGSNRRKPAGGTK